MMTTMRGVGALLLLAGVGWTASACGSSVFACASDDQCQAGAVAGLCQPSGYCSFPDESCPSGQRYGESAPDDVASACVVPNEDTSTSMGEASTHGGEPPAPDPDGTPEGSTTSLDETSTTTPMDDAATTEPETTRGVGSEDTTTGAVATCQVAFEDDFDGSELSPMWSALVPATVEAFVDGGQLSFAVGASNAFVTAHVLTEAPALAGGWVRVRIGELEQPDLPISAGLVVGNAHCQLQLTLEPTNMAASVWNEQTQLTTWLGTTETVIPTWLQLRQDEDGLTHFEWSPDAVSWRELAAGTFPECGDLSNGLAAGVRVGSELVQGVGVRSFDRFDACFP